MCSKPLKVIMEDRSMAKWSYVVSMNGRSVLSVGRQAEQALVAKYSFNTHINDNPRKKHGINDIILYKMHSVYRLYSNLV